MVRPTIRSVMMHKTGEYGLLSSRQCRARVSLSQTRSFASSPDKPDVTLSSALIVQFFQVRPCRMGKEGYEFEREYTPMS